MTGNGYEFFFPEDENALEIKLALFLLFSLSTLWGLGPVFILKKS